MYFNEGKGQECGCHTDIISGQAFTQYECRGCQVKFHHQNTHVPVFCPSCAKLKNVCRYCANPMEEDLDESFKNALSLHNNKPKNKEDE